MHHSSSGTPTFDPSATSSQNSFAFSAKSNPPTSSVATLAKESPSHKNNQNKSAVQSGSLGSDTKQSSIDSPQFQPPQTNPARSESNGATGESFSRSSQNGEFNFDESPGTVEPNALKFPRPFGKTNGSGSLPKGSNPLSFSSFGFNSTKKSFAESGLTEGFRSGSKTAAPSFFGFTSPASTKPGFSLHQTGAVPGNIGGGTTIKSEPKTTSNSHRDRLIAFYQMHNSEKVGSVDVTLEKYRGREEELFTKLTERYETYPKAMGDGPQYILNTSLGTIVVRVFANIVPMAAANFGSLCLGRPVPPANRSNIKSYENTPWHRVVPGQLIQGGDTTLGNGTGGRSAFDQPLAHDMWGHFNDEEFLAHDRAGLLSMANTG